ncbi:MAG TPA: class I SAM-dependent methyltransferase [Candidatus Bilamarchaeum sp.]|nr:class I SAM-dependent methyltransferase [Candidatus Bilamarchaeum sp.]
MQAEEPEPRGPKTLKGNGGAEVVGRVPFANTRGEIEGIRTHLSEGGINQVVEKAFAEIAKIKETSGGDLDELERRMACLLYDLASRNELDYTLTVNKLLMRHWTQRTGDGLVAYNAHMQEHVDAIDTLFEGAMKEVNTRFRGNRKLRILDVSCGTGEVLKKFLDRLPDRVLSRLKIVANDASPAALDVCRETLRPYEGRVKKITYTNMDISEGRLPDGKFHVVLESQSLEFISDDRIIKAKRLGQTIRQDEDEYDKNSKRVAVAALFDKLVPERGLLLIVQEDPMMLSKPGRTPDGVITRMLFDEIFRPIRKEELINDILKAIPGAKFVCDQQVQIDRSHDMYIAVSSRSRKKDARIGTYHSSKSVVPQPAALRTSRDFDVHETNIIQAMEGIYPILLERLKKFDGHEQFRPITGTRLVIDEKKWEDEASKPWFWRRNGTNDLVIVSGLIHKIGIEQYQRLIDNLNSSGKAKPGTVLLFIDTWPAPAGKVDDHVGNGDARKYVFRRPDHTFLAAYRSGNKYGYLYVKRDLLSRSGESTAADEDEEKKEATSLPLQPTEG